MFFMGQKILIEVTQCSGEEMNLVLAGLISSNLTNQSSNNQIMQTNFATNVFSSINQIPSYMYPTDYSSQATTPASQLPIIPNQYSYSPIMWYYPTPPISPSSYFLHSQLMQSFNNPVILVLKNAPFDISSNEIYEFLNGYDVG